MITNDKWVAGRVKIWLESLMQSENESQKFCLTVKAIGKQMAAAGQALSLFAKRLFLRPRMVNIPFSCALVRHFLQKIFER